MRGLNLLEQYSRWPRTTNRIERLNEEARGLERVIRILPNVGSAKRLVGALLMENDEAWSTDWQYFDMSTYVEWKQEWVALATGDVPETAASAGHKRG